MSVPSKLYLAQKAGGNLSVTVRFYLCLFSFLVDTSDLIYRNSTKGKSKKQPAEASCFYLALAVKLNER